MYKEYFLNKKIKNILEILEKQEILTYKNLDELICKLILNDKIDEIRKEEKLNKNLEKELIKTIKYLLKKTIILSIKNNKLPVKKIANSYLEKYYSSKANSLNLIYEKFKNKDSKKELLKKVIIQINQIISVIKSLEFSFEHLYFYNQIILILIKILFEFNSKISNQIKDLFYQYFKEDTSQTKKVSEGLGISDSLKFQISKISINQEIEELIFQIYILKKISKKKIVYIKIKKNFDLNLLPNRIRNLKEESIGFYLNPNKKKFKKIFHYSYKEALDKINKLKSNQINKN